MLTQNESLAAAEVAIFAILLLPTQYILYRHGLRGFLGWYLLIGFEALQIASAALTLSAGDGISTIGLILSSVGLSPLVLSSVSILHEVDHMHGLNLYFFKNIFVNLMFHGTIIGAAIIAGIGGSKAYSFPPSQTGYDLLRAGIFIILAAWVVLVGVTLLSLRAEGRLGASSPLLRAVTYSLPFIFLRLLYAILSSTVTSTNTFRLGPGSSFPARVVMAVLPGLVISTAFVIAGLLERPATVQWSFKGSKKQEKRLISPTYEPNAIAV